MLALGADDIHIHLLRPESIIHLSEEILDSAEQRRALSFKFNKDRDAYVAAHVFLRQVLSSYATVTAKDWLFAYNNYGKPGIVNPGYQWLHFNLSHSQGMVACAVVRNRAVGVDVEHRRALCDLPQLCRSALSPMEADAVLSALHPEARQHRFFSYWTLKEAYIKARGKGLSLPLQHFSLVKITDHGWQLDFAPDFEEDGRHWQINTCPLHSPYYLAYCVQVSGPSTPPLTVRIIEWPCCEKPCRHALAARHSIP